jgi:xyloglucan fucosyltransferase
MVMGRPSQSHGGGGGGDEERLPLRGGLETERAPPPHHAAEQLTEARRGGGGRLWRASVRAGLVLCLLTVPAVLLLLRWQADSSPQWVFDFEAPEEDDDQGTPPAPTPSRSPYTHYPYVLASSTHELWPNPNGNY